MRILFSLLFVVVAPVVIFAQSNSSNLIKNGSFEENSYELNPWTTSMQGSPPSARVLSKEGGVNNEPMPISVATGDLNGDGLIDIAMMDGMGYLKIYFNCGSLTEPKFSPAEVSGLVLNAKSKAVDDDEDLDNKKPQKQGPSAAELNNIAAQEQRAYVMDSVKRLNFVDLNRSGKLDLFIGTYGGRIIYVPNSGTRNKPDFRTPSDMKSSYISIGENEWGNVFAPYVIDWNKDGKMDILVGEGSYSANSIHILASRRLGVPSFEDKDRSVLAYGMGLEQLCPTVVDFNGDGNDDLLFTERSGKVAVCLNKGEPWAKDKTLEFDSFIKLGEAYTPAPTPSAESNSDSPVKKDPMDAAKASNLLSGGGTCTIATADFNGDGLFDIIFGKRSGKVSLSLNEGTKTQPKFSKMTDIVVQDINPKLYTPDDKTFRLDSGDSRGNIGGYFAAIKSENAPSPSENNAKPSASPVSIPDGKYFAQAGYANFANKLMPVPKPISKGRVTSGRRTLLPPNTYELRYNFESFPQDNIRATKLKPGKTYELSFKVRGNQLSNGEVVLQWRISRLTSAGTVTKSARGADIITGRTSQEAVEKDISKLAVTPEWKEFKKDIKVEFKDKSMDVTSSAYLYISFDLAPGVGEASFDDFKLIEK
jgi:hypothetical protein